MQYKYLDYLKKKEGKEVCGLLNSFAIGVNSGIISHRDPEIIRAILRQRNDLTEEAGKLAKSKGCEMQSCKTCDPNQKFSVLDKGLCVCPKK